MQCVDKHSKKKPYLNETALLINVNKATDI